MTDLGESRKAIDCIDRQIVDLFEKRMKVTNEVAEYKKSTGMKVLDTKREQEKLDVLGALASTEFNERAIRELFSQIMSISRKYQYTLLAEQKENFEAMPSLPRGNDTTVCYFGAPGSYSEQAMEEYFGTDVASFPAASFKEVMEAVQSGRAEFGVLPIENSTTGGITDSYDLLMEYDNYLIGEHIVKIEHALLGVPGAALSDIQVVYSHAQGLRQCKKFLEAHPQIKPITASSTSESARQVQKAGEPSFAAIAGKRAAELYGLSVLQECLNTEEVNSTRFIIISNKKQYLPGANKISICFELPHESGSLYKMLSHIMYNNLNMTKIESRPIPGRNFEYRFFVDFEGKITEPAVQNTLNGIRQEASRLKILGNIAVE